MGERETLLALVERVEAATQYDARLMAEIDCAVKFRYLRPAEPEDHPTVRDRVFDASSIWTPTGWLMSRNYYSRIDDAMELVPDGWQCERLAWWEGTPSSCWLVGTVEHDGQRIRWGGEGRSESRAATPALALTAAALRARAASCD